MSLPPLHKNLREMSNTMEINKMHKDAKGSIIGHTGSKCQCSPVKSIVATNKNKGRFSTVYYIHN